MTFVMPSDRAYKHAKRIRLGEARIDPVFDGFVVGFTARFGVAPLALDLDSVKRADGSGLRARLGVVLERTAQHAQFTRSPFGYDPAAQAAVAVLFRDAMAGRDLRRVFGFPRLSRTTSGAVGADLFVCFEDFERVAVQEVHGSVTAQELDAFTASLGLPDGVCWCVQRLFGPPIVFVHTQAQADAVRAGSLPERWADAYFGIARRHDPFGYIARESVAITVDSKENLDRNFDGNWFYYFK